MNRMDELIKTNLQEGDLFIIHKVDLMRRYPLVHNHRRFDDNIRPEDFSETNPLILLFLWSEFTYDPMYDENVHVNVFLSSSGHVLCEIFGLRQ